MELSPNNLPSEGSESPSVTETASSSEELSQSDKDARLRKRILIGVVVAAVIVGLMGIRGPISIARKSKEEEWADFAQLVGEEAEIVARNQGRGADHERPGQFEKRSDENESRVADQQAKKNQTSERVVEATPHRTASRSRAAASKTIAKYDSKSVPSPAICYEDGCQVKAQRGFPSFNKMTAENLDGWFRRDEYLLAVRSIMGQGNIEKRVARVKADLAEYAKLKKRSSSKKATLDELRTQVLKGWLALPVLPPRMSLRGSENGVLGTLSARDEVMEIASVSKEAGSILVKNLSLIHI